MTSKLSVGLFAIVGALAIAHFTACTTVTKVEDGVTNTVRVIDPVRLAQARDALEPAASSVLRRAILRSPEHADEIAAYARAVQSVFCSMSQNRNFAPAYLIEAANAATAPLQAEASAEIIDAKNAAIALYKIFYGDQLTWEIPGDAWPMAICQLFCESIDEALEDAGR
jgi:hypothetical protein